MKVKIYGLLIAALFSSSTYAAVVMRPVGPIAPWVDVPITVLSESEKLKSECKKLEFTPKSIKKYIPEFPFNGAKNKSQGWAVLDFKINTDGKTTIVKTVDQSHSIFQKQAIKALKKLSFIVPDNWNATCVEQVYRIGYAFRLMSECSGNEFPKPIIGVCTVGLMVEIR